MITLRLVADGGQITCGPDDLPSQDWCKADAARLAFVDEVMRHYLCQKLTAETLRGMAAELASRLAIAFPDDRPFYVQPMQWVTVTAEELRKL